MCMGTVPNAVRFGWFDLFCAIFIIMYAILFDLVTRESVQKERLQRNSRERHPSFDPGCEALCGRKEVPYCTSRYLLWSAFSYFVSLTIAPAVFVSTQLLLPTALFSVPILLIGIFSVAAYSLEAKLLWTLNYNNYPTNEELI